MIPIAVIYLDRQSGYLIKICRGKGLEEPITTAVKIEQNQDLLLACNLPCANCKSVYKVV